MTPILPRMVSARTSSRSEVLARRLEAGARALFEFASQLTDAEWQSVVPGDGRRVGVVVHHVASIYPLEVRLAEMVAAGRPITGITWATVHEMNAAHAIDHADATKADTLSLLRENSTAAGAAVRVLSDDALDTLAPVSLYDHSEMSCQFLLEDHAVRHSAHHLARLRRALGV